MTIRTDTPGRVLRPKMRTKMADEKTRVAVRVAETIAKVERMIKTGREIENARIKKIGKGRIKTNVREKKRRSEGGRRRKSGGEKIKKNVGGRKRKVERMIVVRKIENIGERRLEKIVD